MASPSPAAKSRLVLRGLYRSLWRAAAPFSAKHIVHGRQQSNSNSLRTHPQPSAVVMNCLLDRTGYFDWEDDHPEEDQPWMLDSTDEEDDFIMEPTSNQKDTTGLDEDSPFAPNARNLVRRLVREVISGSPNGERQMQWPHHVDPLAIRKLLHREFRSGQGVHPQSARKDNHDDDDTNYYASRPFSDSVRRQAAFMTLRLLNEKLGWYEDLVQIPSTSSSSKSSNKQSQNHHAPIQPPPSLFHMHPNQAALHVSPLLPKGPHVLRQSADLQAGVYLLAHPKMTGYFRRTVICLLDHQPAQDAQMPHRGTYGLVVNRQFSNPQHQPITLKETFTQLPAEFLNALGHMTVRDGGPVHASLQMLHSLSASQEESLSLGGHVLAHVAPEYSSDLPVCFAGNIRHAAAGVQAGQIDPTKDLTFFAGNCGWTRGQLEREIDHGVWIPVAAPPEIALQGKCQYRSIVSTTTDNNDHDSDNSPSNLPPPHKDLWLSMMSACGPEYAELAHLMYPDDGLHDFGGPCDQEEEESDLSVAFS